MATPTHTMIDAIHCFSSETTAVPPTEREPNPLNFIAQKAFAFYKQLLFACSPSSLRVHTAHDSLSQEALTSLMLNPSTERYLRVQLIAFLGQQNSKQLQQHQQMLEKLAFNLQEDPCCRLAALHCLSLSPLSYQKAKKSLRDMAKNSLQNSILRHTALGLWIQAQEKKEDQENSILQVLNNGDEDPYLRCEALKLFEQQQIDPQRVLPHLKKLFQDRCDSLRIASTLQWLRMKGKSPESFSVFKKLIQNPSEDFFLRARALKLFATLYTNDPRAKAFLETMLKTSQDIHFRSAIVANWGKVEKESDKAMAFLWPWIQSKDELEMKEAAIEALRDLNLSSQELVKTLITLVENTAEDAIIREVATETLAHVKPFSLQVIRALNKLFLNENQNENLRHEAIQTLQNFSSLSLPDNFLNPLKACVSNSKMPNNLRLAAVHSLGKLGNRDTFSFLCSLAESKKEKEGVRKAAIKAVGNMKELSEEKRNFFYQLYVKEKTLKGVQQLALSKFLEEKLPSLDPYIDRLLQEIPF